jgi:hypothetical protein
MNWKHGPPQYIVTDNINMKTHRDNLDMIEHLPYNTGLTEATAAIVAVSRRWACGILHGVAGRESSPGLCNRSDQPTRPLLA